MLENGLAVGDSSRTSRRLVHVDVDSEKTWEREALSQTQSKRGRQCWAQEGTGRSARE